MVRKLRVEYSGAIYDVMNRGGTGAPAQGRRRKNQNRPATARGNDNDLELDNRAHSNGHAWRHSRLSAQDLTSEICESAGLTRACIDWPRSGSPASWGCPIAIAVMSMCS